MRGYRKNHRVIENQKTVTDIPEQWKLVFSWIILTGLFIIFLVGIMYLVLRFESPEYSETTVRDTVLYRSSAFRVPELPMDERLKTRELCSALSNVLYSLEPMNYVSDINRQSSKLTTLDINSGDMHYVFTNNSHVPWLFLCCLESALNAVNNNSRVNVFVVDGIEFQRPLYGGLNVKLMSKFVSDRLNVIYITLEECLKGSPFQGVDLRKHPLLAEFAVQLVLLWQFGGTVLDNNMIAIREKAYRTSGTAVEYGDRMISSPFACHAFIYDAMLNAKNLYSMYLKKHGMFNQEIGRKIKANTVERTRRVGRGNECRPVADGIVCRSVTNDRCYYLEVDLVTPDSSNYVQNLCPIVGKATFPDIRKPTSAASRNKHTNESYR